MRVLVTGAGGMLGRDLCHSLSQEHQVIATDVASPKHEAAGHLLLDVTDLDAVRDAFARTRPDVVIHCAAWTDVDGCEQDPARAFAVNAQGTWNVAAGCQQVGARMVYVSTDFVFDGEKGAPYDEFDRPNPISHYGASKLAGEEAVRALVPEHWIVRPAWLFGHYGRNFVETMLRISEGKDEIRVVSDQAGSPTFTMDLSQALGELLEIPGFGTYHITNGGSCSRAEYAAAILSLASEGGLTSGDVKVVPISSDEYPLPARRPRDSSLRHGLLDIQGRDNLRPWKQALQAYFATRPRMPDTSH